MSLPALPCNVTQLAAAVAGLVVVALTSPALAQLKPRYPLQQIQTQINGFNPANPTNSGPSRLQPQPEMSADTLQTASLAVPGRALPAVAGRQHFQRLARIRLAIDVAAARGSPSGSRIGLQPFHARLTAATGRGIPA